MDFSEYQVHHRFYEKTVATIEALYPAPQDLCFVCVQHAFLPTLKFLSAIDDQVAAIVPKGSSSKCNPDVVAQFSERFGGRMHGNITRAALADPAFAVAWLRRVTQGRPFAILEYGGYFAPAATAISRDPDLGPRLVGFVEGTENGIKGSDDGGTPGYQSVVSQLHHPVVSKSRSRIKAIMDIEIGPAIVYATDTIFRRNLGCSLRHWRGRSGVIGLGGIGKGVLQTLASENRQPDVFDTDPAVMAELSVRGNRVVSQRQVLQSSDLLFLNTGSCFLARSPELLDRLKDNVVIVLCTSGDVEAGVPQLVANGHLELCIAESTADIAVYKMHSGKRVRILLACDGVGQAPNMSLEDGSSSPANLMSDMEFYALGKYLGSAECRLVPGEIHNSPQTLEDPILQHWLNEFYPSCVASDEHSGTVQREHPVAETIPPGRRVPKPAGVLWQPELEEV